MKLVLATNNEGKVREFARILEPLGIEVMTQKQAGVHVSPEENGTTFAENARIKAMAVYEATGLPTVADDSGLCIDAMNGEPGVYSARYYGEDTPYEEKNHRIIESLKGVAEENGLHALWHTLPVCFPKTRSSTVKACAKEPSDTNQQETEDLVMTRSFMSGIRALRNLTGKQKIR